MSSETLTLFKPLGLKNGLGKERPPSEDNTYHPWPTKHNGRQGWHCGYHPRRCQIQLYLFKELSLVPRGENELNCYPSSSYFFKGAQNTAYVHFITSLSVAIWALCYSNNLANSSISFSTRPFLAMKLYMKNSFLFALIFFPHISGWWLLPPPYF